jgi:lipopolysaccharide heptosyltransferase I
MIDLRTLEPRRVCLIKPSSLGDIAHATPVLAALRERWPSAHLAWVVNAGLAQLVEGLPGLDEVIRFDRRAARPTPRGLVSTGRFLAGLRRRGFDVAIDLQGLLRSGLMAWATGAPVRAGLSDAREGATRFYTHRVPMPPRATTHAVDRLRRMAEAFGAPASPPRFLTPATEADRAWARRALAGVPRPRLVLNVGARWATKRWPPEKFARVGRLAAERLGAGLVAVGAPEDRPLVEALAAALGDVPLLDLAGRTSLPQLAAVAAESDLMLSNDTGPVHLAVAAGAKTIGIFTCTNPEETGPYGPLASVVRTKVWCAGSYVQACRRMECMLEVTPERVWAEVARRLGAPGEGVRPSAA